MDENFEFMFEEGENLTTVWQGEMVDRIDHSPYTMVHIDTCISRYTPSLGSFYGGRHLEKTMGVFLCKYIIEEPLQLHHPHPPFCMSKYLYWHNIIVILS